MMDANEYIKKEGGLYNFVRDNKLMDIVPKCNTSLSSDPTYIHSSKRLDYILLSPNLAEITIKAGHHKFYQHIISDHKGVYEHFRAEELFDTETIDGSQLV